MTPNEAAKQIGTELGQSNPKGDARLASDLAQPTTQHTQTPGPWHVNGYGYRRNDASPTGRGVYICGPDSGLAEGFTVNAANVEVCRMDRHTRGSDARLIAASPCMLEACGEAMSAIEAWKDKDDDAEAGLRAAALLLADAIAKATGGK